MNTFLDRGFVAVKARKPAEAAQWFEKAWQEMPDNHHARAWLGQSLCSIGRREEGISHLLGAGKALIRSGASPSDFDFALEMAGQLQHWNDFNGALELLKGVVEINPESFRAHQLIAAAYAQLNRKTEALASAEKALALAPENHMMQVFLGSLEADAGRAREARNRMESVLGSKPNPREAFRAHKELARILDKLGEHDQVFAHLHAAGELSRLLPEYAQQDAMLVPNMLRENQAEYDRKLMGRWVGTEFPPTQPAPCFIVGFMRSGTTLTQEVLDAHPGIVVADEIDFVTMTKRELHAIDKSTGSTADKLKRLDLSGVLHLRDHYWRNVRERFGDVIDKQLFVDKFTMNIVDLGLINCLFPDAKVIFVMRDPRDVCLSCHMQLMVPTPTTVQLLTWEGTARFYAQVMDWWIHIRNQMTVKLIELRYENAVVDFEQTFRQIFDFLGLPWDSEVTQFHKHSALKHVASPSRTQVTQALYASSVARWRFYESDVARIWPRLQPYVMTFGYGEERVV